jgi:hypothetical protein
VSAQNPETDVGVHLNVGYAVASRYGSAAALSAPSALGTALPFVSATSATSTVATTNTRSSPLAGTLVLLLALGRLWVLLRRLRERRCRRAGV